MSRACRVLWSNCSVRSPKCKPSEQGIVDFLRVPTLVDAGQGGKPGGPSPKEDAWRSGLLRFQPCVILAACFELRMFGIERLLEDLQRTLIGFVGFV